MKNANSSETSSAGDEARSNSDTDSLEGYIRKLPTKPIHILFSRSQVLRYQQKEVLYLPV